MRILRTIGKLFWRFMVIFSFIVNLILVVVLLVLGLLIFDIKNNIAQPLVGGLHSSFVGLDKRRLTGRSVRDTIPVVLNIPLETDTTVVLNAPVPLTVNALIDLPGINAYNVNARVELELPQGLALPVKLDLDVPVDAQLDVSLDVRAVIPLKETQLQCGRDLRLCSGAGAPSTTCRATSARQVSWRATCWREDRLTCWRTTPTALTPGRDSRRLQG
jgi:hypothetical protein